MAVYKKVRQRRKPMGEINVVPYIDVMLVLLIIFMVTAPLLTQGVKVELPKADAEPVEMPDENTEPLVVSVDVNGNFYVAIGDNQDEPIDAQELMAKTAAVLRRNPKTPVMVKGDNAVNYGYVVSAMAYLQAAGASSVGLITQQPDQPEPVRNNAN
ncbi:Tol biopolymer transport system, TolR protein [Methylophaga thiooxydans]|uniref:Tol-Pal system protein TolR n=1 Tax=Methylophaga thiooxydans TaxID=392484 RepID=A0A0A0BGD7_9GAMM|nr:protein TolR [Methylophaga thiooxydans]KGM07593.1 Tol biopolymer transport system, TolR protein [Methylophaga thiooxydans]